MHHQRECTRMKSIGQMEEKKPTEKIERVQPNPLKIDPNNQYAASYLKTGSTRGIMYQMKIITWITWKLMCQNDANISKWWLATEVREARGFHDLVVKYTTNDTPNGGFGGKYLYRFVQIKHKTSLQKNGSITNTHLTSKNKAHRQGSLFYLFRSYVNMLDKFEKITPDQIVDLNIVTNMDINSFKFLVPVKNDELFDFGKGKRYRLDANALRKEPGVMICLYGITKDDNIISSFLRKLVFIVGQPSEPELEERIINEMGKTFNAPQIFYNDLYKNIINWFLIYDAGRAPYLTEDDVMKYLKKMQDVLWDAKRMDMLVDPVSTLADKLRSLCIL